MTKVLLEHIDYPWVLSAQCDARGYADLYMFGCRIQKTVEGNFFISKWFKTYEDAQQYLRERAEKVYSGDFFKLEIALKSISEQGILTINEVTADIKYYE